MPGGNVKFGGYKGGRGYCGYYTNKDGKKVFLRSLKEFIIAKKLDYYNDHFLTECVIFKIDGENYKPDFFIYDLEYKILKKIIEVKNSQKECERYIKYKPYFELIKIEYEIIYNIDSRKKVEYVSKNDIQEWKNQYIKNYNFFNFSGEKNPMFGVKHSKKTKKLIGLATRKYFKDPEIRLKHKLSREIFWKSDAGKNQKIYYANLRHKERNEKNPVVEMTCINCGIKFKRRKNDKYHANTCSSSCIQKYNWKIGKNKYHGNAKQSYKTKIVKYATTINEDFNDANYNDIIKKYKECGKIPKSFGMSILVVQKYFGSLKNLKLEILNGKTS